MNVSFFGIMYHPQLCWAKMKYYRGIKRPYTEFEDNRTIEYLSGMSVKLSKAQSAHQPRLFWTKIIYYSGIDHLQNIHSR